MAGYEGFAELILELVNPTSLTIVLLATALCAILSLVFTRKLFKMHFIKAGLV